MYGASGLPMTSPSSLFSMTIVTTCELVGLGSEVGRASGAAGRAWPHESCPSATTRRRTPRATRLIGTGWRTSSGDRAVDILSSDQLNKQNELPPGEERAVRGDRADGQGVRQPG